MADVANLQIKVSADVADLKASLASANAATKDFAAQTAASFNAAGQHVNSLGLTAKQSIAIYNQKMAELRGENVKTDASFVELGNVATSETSRVGKALNNLVDPSSIAVTAISRIRRELIGLGLVEIIGTAIPAIYEFVKGLVDANSAIDTLKASTQDFAEINENANKSAGSNIADLRILYAATQDVTLSQLERNKAVKELQDLYPETFKNFSAEQIELGKAKSAYDSLTQSILKKALASAAEGKLSELATEELNLFTKNEEKLAELRSKLGAASLRQNDAGIYTQGYIDLIVQQGKNYTNALQSIKDRAQKIIDFVGTGNLADAVIGNPDKAARDVDTIAKELEKLRIELAGIDAEQKAIGISADDYKKKISDITSTIDILEKKFKVNPADTIIQKLFGDIQTIRIEETIRRIQEAAKKVKIEPPPIDLTPVGNEQSNFDDYAEAVKAGLELRLNALHIKFNPNLNPEGLEAQLKSGEAVIAKFNDGIEKGIKNTLANVATSVGEGIANILTQTGSIGDLFKGIFHEVGAGLKQLGAYFIAAALEVKIFKDFITKNPVLAVVAGIGLVALGTIIETETAKKNAFASGVTNFAGGIALVGERGPELVNLPKGSDVIPNHDLGNALGGVREVPYIASYTVSGNDLRVILNRANATYSRNT